MNLLTSVISGDTTSINFRLIREIQRRELAVVFFCGFVVCLCGLNFIFEIPDGYILSFMANNYSPFF